MSILETVKEIFKYFGIIDINTKIMMNLKGGYSDLGGSTLHELCVMEVTKKGFGSKVHTGEEDGYVELDYSNLKKEEFTITRNGVTVKMYKDKINNRSCLSISRQSIILMNCYLSDRRLVKDESITTVESDTLFKEVKNFI